MIDRDELENKLVARYTKKYPNIPRHHLFEIVSDSIGIGQQSIMDEYRDNQLDLIADVSLRALSKRLHQNGSLQENNNG